MAGLGRAYLTLQHPGKEKYRDIVQWGCLNLMTINAQSDGHPDEYVFRLVTSYDDPESFLAPIVNAYRSFTWDFDVELFQYYTRLLGHFAAYGCGEAKEALELRFREFCEVMAAPDFEPAVDHCDYEDEMLCEIAIALIGADRERYLPMVALALGHLLETLDGTHFEWLYTHLEEQSDRAVLAPLAERHEKEVSNFLLDLYVLLEERMKYNKLIFPFIRRVSEEHRPEPDGVELSLETSILAPLRDRLLEADPDLFEPRDDKAEDEGDDDYDDEESPYEVPTDEEEDESEDDEGESPYDVPSDEDDVTWRFVTDAKARTEEERELMRFVKRDAIKKKRYYDDLVKNETLLRSEAGFKDLISCLDFYDDQVRESAREIFASLSHDKAIRYALDRLYVAGAEWWTVEILLRNYCPEFKPLILSKLYEMPRSFDEDLRDWLSVVHSITWLPKATQSKLPDEIFRYVYEGSLSRRTRYDAMIVLYERGALTVAEQTECYYDASPRIRSFAAAHAFARIL